MFAPRFLQNTALLLCFVLLVGCGFKLRTASVLPNDLQNLVVTANNPDSQLFAELQKSLALSNINTTDSSSSSAELKLLHDSLTRRTLSLFPNGQVAEHELIYTVRYQLIRDKQKPITNSFTFESNFTKEEYCDAVNAIKNYIAEGDVMQVVLAQDFPLTLIKTHLICIKQYAN